MSAQCTTAPLPSVEAMTKPVGRYEPHPVYGSMLLLRGVLEDDLAAALLFQKFLKLKEGPYSRALNSAHTAITMRRDEWLVHVVRRGQLLLCWHGTKAVQVLA